MAVAVGIGDDFVTHHKDHRTGCKAQANRIGKGQRSAYAATHSAAWLPAG